MSIATAGATSTEPHPTTTESRLAAHWQTRAVAALILGVATIGIWWPVFGAGALWAVPILVWSMLIATRVIAPAGLWSNVAVGVSWLVWIPLAALLVGLPVSSLDPTSATDTFRSALDGLREAGEGTGGPWALAAWLWFLGLAWVRGASNSIREGTGPAAWAFIYFAGPFIAAILLGHADDAAWHGAVLLASALLWATAGSLRGALPAVMVVALFAALVGSAGPTERRIPLRGERPANGEMDWSLSYGPDRSPHTGAVYLDIRSPIPALWRAQVLDRFDGRTWQPSFRDPATDLPQPAAATSTANVTVRRYRDVRAIGAGRISSITGPPSERVALGEATQFTSTPTTGTRYTVTAQVVRAELGALEQVQVPDSSRYEDQTALWTDLPDGMDTPIARHVGLIPPQYASTERAQVLRLAHDMSKGTRSELELVRRVSTYLTQSGRFRYSRTDVEMPGDDPLLTFLTRTHVGYCQHFAGSAALLLRMMGVPTRVVVGFGTGKEVGSHHYEVSDSDGHAWIEVYFEGYGWVPFNPTPSDAAAQIASTVDPLQPEAEQRAAGEHGSRTIGLAVLGVLAVVGAGFLVMRSIRRRRDADEGDVLAERLVRLAPGPMLPSTTVAAVMPDLERIGPSVAALGEQAQRERFDPAGGRVPRARRQVWRALRRDVGLLRAARLMLFGGRGGGGPAGAVHGTSSSGLGSTSSVAPPPQSSS